MAKLNIDQIAELISNKVLSELAKTKEDENTEEDIEVEENPVIDPENIPLEQEENKELEFSPKEKELLEKLENYDKIKNENETLKSQLEEYKVKFLTKEKKEKTEIDLKKVLSNFLK